jgi:predicted PurR-regulated permease PerM
MQYEHKTGSFLSNPRVFFGFLVVVALALTAMAPHYIQIVVAASIFASATEPAVERLQRFLRVRHAVAAVIFVIIFVIASVMLLRFFIPLVISGISEFIYSIPRDGAWWQEVLHTARTELGKIVPPETVDQIIEQIRNANIGQALAYFVLSIINGAGHILQSILIFLGAYLFTLIEWKWLTSSLEDSFQRAWPNLSGDVGWLARRFQKNLTKLCKVIFWNTSVFTPIFGFLFATLGVSPGKSAIYGLIFGTVASIPTIGPIMVYPIALCAGALIFVVPEFTSKTLIWTWPEIMNTASIIWHSTGVRKLALLMLATVGTHLLESWIITPIVMKRQLEMFAMALMVVLGPFVIFEGLTLGVIFGLALLVFSISWYELTMNAKTSQALDAK